MASTTLILADDLNVEVYYDYLPGESALLYPHHLAHHGSTKSVDITAVIVKNDEGREVNLLPVLNQEAVDGLVMDALQDIWDRAQDAAEYYEEDR